jgi:phosphopantetheinyl transferase
VTGIDRLATVSLGVGVLDREMPDIRLLDANALCLDDQALRDLARDLTEKSGAACVSRSYSYPLALVACHYHPVGVDVERIAPCDAAFADLICTRDERLEVTGSGDADRSLTSLWSSKEALAKGLGDARRYEPSRLESPARWPSQASGAWRCRELAVDDDHVAWVCWQTGGHV